MTHRRLVVAIAVLSVAGTSSRARERLNIEDAMGRGDFRLQYNTQAFQLAESSETVYFIRAEWLVGRQQGFVGTLWVRGGEPLEETNVRPPSWVRSRYFREASFRDISG